MQRALDALLEDAAIDARVVDLTPLAHRLGQPVLHGDSSGRARIGDDEVVGAQEIRARGLCA